MLPLLPNETPGCLMMLHYIVSHQVSYQSQFDKNNKDSPNISLTFSPLLPFRPLTPSPPCKKYEKQASYITHKSRLNKRR